MRHPSVAIPQHNAGFVARRLLRPPNIGGPLQKKSDFKVLAQVAPARRDLANRKPVRRMLQDFPVVAFEPSLRARRATTAESRAMLEKSAVHQRTIRVQN
jgi:hypothetical protein